MVTYARLSKPGNRDVNEDSVAVYEKNNLLCFVLCDGLGGHGHGEVASALVTASVGSSFEAEDICLEDFLPSALDTAQRELLEKQLAEHATLEMKTTATVLLLTPDTARWASIGDSRLYVFKNKKIKTRTLDHSVPQMLVKAKQLREKKIRFHPDRNKLLRVMGTEWEKPGYTLSDAMPVSECDAFLLCSDGFWELIDERKMCSALKKSKSAAEWLDMMCGFVEKKGAGLDMDNYSAIAVFNN